MSVQQDFFNVDMTPASVPIWLETFMGVDWLALRYSPVYYCWGVPLGDGAPVVVVPGFMATDFYLQEMYYWLRRMGYRPYMSQIGRNSDCMEKLVQKLLLTVDKAYQETGRKVTIIGHSLGGVLARASANLAPDKIDSVITMGSPIRGISSHPVVLELGNRVRKRVQVVQDRPGCFTGACNCSAADSLKTDLYPHVTQTAIYTKTDGIVDWRYCVNEELDTNFEVLGTHGGLAFNPMVYCIIARRLAEVSKKGKN